MQTYYDMLDDASKDDLFAAWESLAETARAGSGLLAAMEGGRVPGAPALATRVSEALDGPLARAAAARGVDSGGDADAFEERADAAGARERGELAAVARALAAEAHDEASAIRGAARWVAGTLEGLADELRELQDLAGDTVHAGEV